ncbi:MAG: DUF885 domain-containing protein [Hyphomonas sp.]|uniref:DUF885 family protein n=1 Tax=Hyphomonas sp. TaxID=87 RepID=UPI00349FDC88
MRLFLKILTGLSGLLLVAAFGLYTWFWWKPVGINNYINKATISFAMETPELMTQLGLIDNTPLDFHSGKLGDYTEAGEQKQLAKLRKARAGLDKYGPDGLEGKQLLSYEIVAWFFDDLIRQAEFEHGGYRVNQISGVTVDMPQFLTDTHVIVSEKSAERYVSRVRDFSRVLREVRARVEGDRAAGVIPPDFIIDKSIAGMQAFIEGGAAANILVTSLPARLDKVEGLSAEKKAALVAEAAEAVGSGVVPGYEAMIALMQDMRAQATHDAGIWRIPDGERIYAAALKSRTTTDMPAEEIHALGLSEVARIEAEVGAILTAAGLTEGTQSQRVEALMTDPAHNFTNDDAGRQEMLDYLVQLNEQVMAKAGDYFVTLPPQPLEIVRVPEYSQDSSAGGYYTPPALDGSRPGRFYINQKTTTDNPRWTLPTLLYHEAAPGHHFQISAAQLITGVPMIRKFSPFTAYTEGWALYAERIAATDMGMYNEDALGDLGRLKAEMFRAVRLVVDSGMHAKKWSREEAIAYMKQKTGQTEDEVVREIERYAVWPAQATAYKTGQLSILSARARAEAALGARFDLKQFHEAVLGSGAMPLGILDKVVDEWIAAELAKGA